METITVTFGEVCENHVRNQQLGTRAAAGFTVEELEACRGRFEARGYRCELYDLTALLANAMFEGRAPEPAALLVVRNGVRALADPEQLFCDLRALPWDKHALMRGRVVQKRARWNLCFADEAQLPDYAQGRGTIVAFRDVPKLEAARRQLPAWLGPKAASLLAEGNLYYNTRTTYIGFHGDSERRRVVALRLGAPFPLSYQWYLRGNAVGEWLELQLDGGDLYVMSEKAVGTDWKCSSRLTLRHGANVAP